MNSFFWFGTVIASSILDNLAGVPFSTLWTIRVNRAPKVRISDDAPWVINEPLLSRQPSDLCMDQDKTAKTTVVEGDGASTPNTIGIGASLLKRPTYMSHSSQIDYRPRLAEHGILASFKKGYDTAGKIVIDETRSAHHDPFYVLIAIKGVSSLHSALRVFSKLFSISIFAVGTALFASTTLVPVLGAMTAAILILIGGVFGRVTAMWMASVILSDKPVIQRVVATDIEAEQYMDAMLRIPDCVFEIEGHVVINGRCVKRYNRYMRWSSPPTPRKASIASMPKFFCDYCDVYLTHDSMSVRKAHNSGRNHLRNVVDYYQQIGQEKAQSVIDSITNSYAAEGQESSNPMLRQLGPGGFGPQGFQPGFPGQGPPFPHPGMPPMPFAAGRGMPMPPGGRGPPPGFAPSNIAPPRGLPPGFTPSNIAPPQGMPPGFASPGGMAGSPPPFSPPGGGPGGPPPNGVPGFPPYGMNGTSHGAR
ncbi:hypothetical protein AMS68_000224 [Peltaster fructicola]|uniref:U1 small nuclear ribonucleoprotein C n=1 Tax=Peltaster fructicola TaxID=286661 RepID=A0A6H0XJ03_9PEZI|nr:hypothetical protein AMS68_000224 [Peltaster fructicola]